MEPSYTPETLYTLGRLADDPKQPSAVVVLAGRRYTAGFLLRRVADALQEQTERTNP